MHIKCGIFITLEKELVINNPDWFEEQFPIMAPQSILDQFDMFLKSVKNKT